MRAFFLVCALALPLLAGCDAIVRQNGDYFEAGADAGRFEQDGQACGVIADTEYSPIPCAALEGTGYDQNRAYNAVYGRCMTGRGYAPRAYCQELVAARLNPAFRARRSWHVSAILNALI